MHLARPSFGALAAGISVAVVAFVAVVVVRSWPHSVHELMRERSPIATLSVLLFAASAVVALVVGLSAPDRRAFLLLVPALAILAIDERAMGHERLKHYLLSHVFDWDKRAMGPLGDLPLVAVPLVGAALFWKLRRHFAHGVARALLIAAFLLGVIAVSLDILTIAEPVQAIEELLEVASETLFLLSLLAVRIGCLRATG